MNRVYLSHGILFAVALALCPAAARAAQTVTVTKVGADYTVYHINQPIVTQKTTTYLNITFQAGDLVRVSAGGCVQTGGHGSTWKRYVDPSGSNSGSLYHGLIQIPGHELVRIQSMIGQTLSVPANPSPNTLTLGYEDDGYGDNGYYSHDNGTDNQCLNVGAAWLVIVVQHPVGAGQTGFTPIPTTAGVNGLPILLTDYHDPGFDTTTSTWNGAVCSNEQWLENDPPRYEWTPVYAPTDEYDDQSLGISGLALFPPEVGANGGISGNDVPFTHPFGGVDWETFIAPDAPYTSFLAQSNTGVPPNGNTANNNDEYIEANARANALGLSIPNGVQGNETDQEFMPLPFRALDGDRVAVLGRWIVDCGHPDFHTEIHPPLLFVRAQAIASGTNPDVPVNANASVTYSRIISRPFLTRQEFGDGNLHEHLVNEVEKIFEYKSNRIEAHPLVYQKPFSGAKLFSYVVRAPVLPPTGRLGVVSNQQLMVGFHFTTRTGIAVQVTRETADSVRVYVIMNSATYVPAPLPIRSDNNISFSSLESSESSIAKYIDLLLVGAILERGPVVAANIHRGIITDSYATPIASSSLDGNVFLTPIDSLPAGVAQFSVDNSQPFPIYGWLSLEWRPAPIVIKPVRIERPQR